MLNHLRPAIAMTALFILLTGAAFPLAVTGIAQVALPGQANGSLVRVGATIVGSSLIGQNFTQPRYFWARPSVTADAPYNAASSTGSNLGTTSAALAERVAHTNDLLRTRVNLVQEQQNRKILQSMNVRSAQQLRLQQAVEGLSVVAISYYLIGLTLYAAKAVKAAGVPLNPDLVAGVMVPVIAIGIWASLRKLRKHLHSREKEEKGA